MPVRFPIDPVTAPKTPDAFRIEVKSLTESYHAADVDLLQEIVQNSIDALEDRFGGAPQIEKPRVRIEIDLDSGSILILDNGPGVPDSKIERLATPANTDKVGRRRRGHKGVGLAFAAWSSNKFQFATKRAPDGTIVSGRLENGAKWIAGGLIEQPKIEADPTFGPSALAPLQSGTAFSFGLGAGHELIKMLRRLSRVGVETLIRTWTAAGFLGLPSTKADGYPQWVRDTEFELRIGQGKPFRVPVGYCYPHDFFAKSSFDLRELSNLSVAEQQKLLGKKKCIFQVLETNKIEAFFTNPEDAVLLEKVRTQEVTAYGAFLDSSRSFGDWNLALYSEAPGPGARKRIVKSGIHFATVNMPAGEILDVDLTYGGGNKDRLYVVVQFKEIPPDYGRKTFERYVVEIGQRVAQRLTSDDLVPNRQLLVPSSVPHGQTESEQAMGLEQQRTDAKAKPDLALQNLGVVKEPKSEQDVVALFHALVGSGLLKGYRVLSVFGSNAKYDCIFTYRLEKTPEVIFPADPLGVPEQSFPKKGAIEFESVVLEFKPVLSDLIRDFEEDVKSFEDIRLAVAWDVGEAPAFGGASDYGLSEVNTATREKQFYGESHVISSTAVGRPIHVVLLKPLIQQISRTVAHGP